jgi:HD-GYP domain-containing protein (c-di-GMP phosphodiesterase class II)
VPAATGGGAAEPEPLPESEADPAGAGEVFDDLIQTVDGVRGLVTTRGGFPWAELRRAVDAAAVSLASSADLFWIATSPALPRDSDPVTFHQARVVVLALRVGATAGLDRERLLDVGMAGALIDVGLWALAAGGRGHDTTSPEYRSHPRLSADLVRCWDPPRDGIVEAVLQHHEREQGRGFPQGLEGEAIHPHAKILALVDRYAALTASVRPHEAILDIVRSKNEDFSPPLIKALLTEISVFPPGTPVRLNTGEHARVIGVNRDLPLRPRVEVLADASAPGPSAVRVIDLAATPFVYITGAAAEPA